jgi:pimeloyl-ACP methyl ester carboxylesterase
MIVMDKHTSRPQLLIIPGLGDRAWLYRAVVQLWRRFGYEVSLHAFGWNGERAELEDRQKLLLAHADALPGEQLFVIGASAGGVAAVNLLAERPRIERVITVASPLLPGNIPENELFIASFRQAAKFLDESDEAVRAKLVSVYGRYDSRVSVELSRRPDIHQVELPTNGHASTIFSALTTHCEVLREFLLIGLDRSTSPIKRG